MLLVRDEAGGPGLGALGVEVADGGRREVPGLGVAVGEVALLATVLDVGGVGLLSAGLAASEEQVELVLGERTVASGLEGLVEGLAVLGGVRGDEGLHPGEKGVDDPGGLWPELSVE